VISPYKTNFPWRAIFLAEICRIAEQPGMFAQAPRIKTYDTEPPSWVLSWASIRPADGMRSSMSRAF
jgi:hypothetical protein